MGSIARWPLYSDNSLGLKRASPSGCFCSNTSTGLSAESVCERWIYDPYFQHFTGEEFFDFSAERFGLGAYPASFSGREHF